jgi:hypothetical protein
LWAAGTTYPGNRTLSFSGGESAVANGAIVALGSGNPDTAAVVSAASPANVTIDVTGYFVDPSAQIIVPSLSGLPSPIVVGGTLTLNGSGFTAGSVIKMWVSTSTGATDTNVSGWAPTSWSPTQLTWNVPTSIGLGQGFATVEVIDTDQGYTASNYLSQLLYGNAALNIPTILSIGGVSLDPVNAQYPGAHVRNTVSPGSSVTIGGTGFVGPVVNLFTSAGNVGPITPTAWNGTSLTMTVPNTPATQGGPGVFQVVNTGAGYVVSNAVDAVLNYGVSITGVSFLGSTVTVNGRGFCPGTVLNLFAQTTTGVQNLGGLNGSGAPNITISYVSSSQITFTRPIAALTGNASLIALNAPFTPYTTSNTFAFQLP